MYKTLLSGLASLPQRYVMTLLGFLLTVIASTMKYAVGIALTEMVVPQEPYVDVYSDDEALSCPYFQPMPTQDNSTLRSGQYEWSETTQGLIFGAVFWTYMTLQLPLGLLIERAGPRYILGAGMLLTNLCYLLTPLAITTLGSSGFILTRVILGAGLATVYPALNVLLAKWVPPSEKSKLGAIIYAGENVGFVFSMAMSGLILGSYKGDWPLLFYVYGTLGMAWLVLWAFFGYNDPESHPFISEPERLYLKESLSQHVTNKKLPPTPWLAMAKSLPLWGTIIAQIGHDWSIITIVTELPKYMKTVLHYEIQENGLLTAIPYLVMTVVAVVSGWLSDWIQHSNYLGITTVRKLFTSVAAVGPSLGVVAAMNAGCDRTLVVIMFTLGMATMGFFYPSLAVNTLDLSPNYSGTLMGLIALGGLGGILSPYLAGILAPQSTMEQWRSVFWVTICVLMVTNSFYLVVGSGKVQPWNQPEPQDPEPPKQKLDDRTQEPQTV